MESLLSFNSDAMMLTGGQCLRRLDRRRKFPRRKEPYTRRRSASSEKTFRKLKHAIKRHSRRKQRGVSIYRKGYWGAIEWIRHELTSARSLEILALRGVDTLHSNHPFLEWSSASSYFPSISDLYRWLKESRRTLNIHDLLHRYGRGLYNFLAYIHTSPVRRSDCNFTNPQVRIAISKPLEHSLVLQLRSCNIEYHVNLPKMYRRGFSFHQHVEAGLKSIEERRLNEFTMISSEYDEDFVQYLLEIEDAFHPDSSYLTSVYARPSLRRPRSLTSYERDSTIEWVLDFNHKFGFGTEETIFLAINIIDRYLSRTRGSSVDNPYPSILKLRLIAGAAVFIAWKVDKGAHPRMSYLIELSRLPYDGEDVEEIELDILKALDYRITPYCSAVDWMERLLNCASLVPEDLERPLSLFLLHVSAANHEFLSWKPRRIAACAVFTARRFFDLFWDQAFVFYSGGYEEATLVEGYRMFLDRLDEEQWEGPVWSLGFPVAAFAVNRASTLLREDAMPQYT